MCLTVLSPFLLIGIVLLAGKWGWLFIGVGIMSLVGDWSLFYVPGWKTDREYAQQKVLEWHPDLEDEKVEVLVSAFLRYYKTNLLIMLASSLPWWVLTSWKWTRSPTQRYRMAVGMAFLDDGVFQQDCFRNDRIYQAYQDVGLGTHANTSRSEDRLSNW